MDGYKASDTDCSGKKPKPEISVCNTHKCEKGICWDGDDGECYDKKLIEKNECLNWYLNKKSSNQDANWKAIDTCPKFIESKWSKCNKDWKEKKNCGSGIREKEYKCTTKYNEILADKKCKNKPSKIIEKCDTKLCEINDDCIDNEDCVSKLCKNNKCVLETVDNIELEQNISKGCCILKNNKGKIELNAKTYNNYIRTLVKKKNNRIYNFTSNDLREFCEDIEGTYKLATNKNSNSCIN